MASSLHTVMENLEKKPKWITIVSDNGRHYHNTELMMIMGYWKEWYNIHPRRWLFLEADEAKTAIDSHHAQVFIIGNAVYISNYSSPYAWNSSKIKYLY